MLLVPPIRKWFRDQNIFKDFYIFFFGFHLDTEVAYWEQTVLALGSQFSSATYGTQRGTKKNICFHSIYIADPHLVEITAEYNSRLTGSTLFILITIYLYIIYRVFCYKNGHIFFLHNNIFSNL